MNTDQKSTALTVMVIEDHPDQRDLLAIVLQREGYKVITAANGIEALEKLSAEKVQIALSDIMIYAAWPKFRVFMDGRSDMYGEKFGRDYLRIANVAPGWKETLKKYEIRWVIFNTDSALTAALKDQPDWHSIYSDPIATIFVKNEPKSFNLLAKDSGASEASK